MTPAQIIALVRDALIVVGIAWLVFHIYRDGEERVRKQDMEAVQKQLAANAAKSAQFAEEAKNAEAQRVADNLQVMAAVGAYHQPVRLCNSGSAGAVPGAPATAAGHPAGPGTTNEGIGSDPFGPDLRPAISGFETKFEGYFSACRSILNQWPR